MTALLLTAAFLAMCMAAVNSGFEVGIYSFSRIRLRYRLDAGHPGAKALSNLIEKPEKLISGILVAQNATVYFVTAVVASVIEGWGIPWAEAWSTLSLAIIFFIFVEAVPKNVFRASADSLVYPLSPVYRWVLIIMSPAVVALRAVTHIVVRLGAGRSTASDALFTRERLAFYMREGQSEGVLTRYQLELTHNILRGENITVKRAMIPLERVAAVPAGVSWDEFRAFAVEKGFSRYPVFAEGGGKIAGILNLYDCYNVERERINLPGMMREAVEFEPETHVTEALRTLRERRQSMGVVTVDGAAAGIVTVKDCVEEIVGELYEW
jgi:putative hemolysin